MADSTRPPIKQRVPAPAPPAQTPEQKKQAKAELMAPFGKFGLKFFRKGTTKPIGPAK